jgi:hypothetical protein
MPRPDVVHVLPHAHPLGGTERTVLDLLSSPSLTDFDQRVVFLRGGSLGPFAADQVLAPSANPRPNLLQAARAVLEALAMGVPVISTDVGGVQHIPADAVRRVAVGDVEAVADAISHLLADEAARARASRAGLSAYRRHFSRDRCHAAYRDLYAAYVH